jgi:LysR family transcriptional regulator, glycine cleavage system transcriptional activator
MGTPISLVRIPSLDLIRGFVAVGRRMSITLASQDLCLTQSAVSRQVNALEQRLGVRLLIRGHRSIAFTAEGERLFRSADGALQQLQDVLGEVITSGTSKTVTLSASIGVTGLWLLPRMNKFQTAHPGLDLRVSANNSLVNLRSEGIDLAIRYTVASEAPKSAIRLFGESVAPVAHPAVGLKTLRSTKGLSGQNLLEFETPEHPWLQWSEWLGAMGWSPAKPRGFLRFNHYDQVIHAALAGQGIALGRIKLIQPLIDEGRLVLLTPPSKKASSLHAYWLIQAEENARPDVMRVASWIESEAQASHS